MFQPPLFKEDRLSVIHDLIDAYSFGILIAHEDGEISANHLPFVLHRDLGDKGTLRAHMAKGNPLWQHFGPDTNVMVIFQGPHHYISPGWYASKAENGKVVPTWNYATVHARGVLKLIDDPDWLITQIGSLSDIHEAGRDVPWKIADAPDKYIRGQMKGIIGLEIEIADLTGKWKMSQNKNDADKAGVLAGLAADGDENALEVAKLIRK